jgi:hypothetical protein
MTKDSLGFLHILENSAMGFYWPWQELDIIYVHCITPYMYIFV